MGGSGKKKRKNRSSGDNSESISKQLKTRGPSGDGEDSSDISVSKDVDSFDLSVFVNNNSPSSTPVDPDMASIKDNEPSNKDLMTLMTTINNRLESMENKLATLDILEKK